MTSIKTFRRVILFIVLLLLPTLPASAGQPEPGEPPVITSHAAGLGAAGITAGAAAGCTRPYCVYLPVIQLAPSWIQTQNRQISRDFYLTQYLPSENVPANWTGNHSSCNPGTTSPEFRAAVLRRINYFRSMAGVPGLRSLSDVYNQKAQAAALMMSVNGALSHTPPTTWICYTPEGAEAAGSSDLYLGVYGPAAISGYIMDPGTGNYPVGHRRWILFPPTQQMGTGDIPPTAGYWASNALWVFDTFSPRPATREPYVAWPPPGYVPYQTVFGRWSFSYPGADFSAAGVSMQSGGAGVGLAQYVVVNGYGDNTLVWAPLGAVGDSWPRPNQDTTYSVTVANVIIGGQSRSFTYNVTIFEP